jgi:peroxiredoxin Q/BCP
MAQLRQDYEKFLDRGSEIIVVGPDSGPSFQDYWRKEALPFVGLADPTHSVAKRFGQEVKLLKWGRMPALMVVSKEGPVTFSHYGDSMSDIPTNAQVLAALDDLNQNGAASS